MKKKYNRYTDFLDRFPFIIVAVIIAIAIIFVLIFRAKFTSLFSTGTTTATQQTQSTTATVAQQYPMLISSPADNEVFSFENQSGTVPIKIDSKEDITNTSYKINLVLGDGQIIKTFTSPPYEYNWSPANAADYSITANLISANGNIVSSSNTINFSVQYTNGTSNASSGETSTSTATTIDHSVTINLQILEGPTFVPKGDIYYYRVQATVTGDPLPTVVFSKDDSHGAWGPAVAQINLRRGESYNLGAIASNSFDSQNATITLTAPAGTPQT